MKLSTFYAHAVSMANKLNVSEKEALTKLHKLGYEGIDCDYDSIQSKGTGYFKELCSLGFQISSIYAVFDFARSIDEAKVSSLLNFAKELDCRRVMIIPGFFTEASVTPDGRELEMQKVISGVRFVTEKAKNTHITVTIEDYDLISSPCCRSTDLLRILDEIPELKFTFDTGNFHYIGEDALALAELFAERTAHIHLKDRSNLSLTDGDEAVPCYDGKLMYPSPVGKGIIPIGELLKILKPHVGDNGFAVAEMFGSADYESYLEQSTDFLKSII